VSNGDIDELLNRAAELPHKVDDAVTNRISASIKASLRPVRPLPAPWLLTAGLVLICAAVSLAGAARTGFFGFEKMDALERVLIFSTLAVLAAVSGAKFVSELIPGSKYRASSGLLLGTTCAVLAVVFAFLFRDYHTQHFISVGVTCLVVGVLHAIPTAVLSWLLLRRGYAVNPVAAGIVAGTVAGFAGVAMLELHCPNFEALHVLVWHTAVVPVSAGLGALVGYLINRKR
jgi:hypothetical protein